MIQYVYNYKNGAKGQRHPVACVVGVKHNDEVLIGISVCNKKDHFVKRIAREIALGRALKGSNPELPTGRISTYVYRNSPEGKISYFEENYPKYMAIQDTVSYVKERLEN